MSHLPVATLLGLLIALSNACAGGKPARNTDAGARDGGRAHADASAGDAGAAPSGEVALNSLLIAELIETEGSLVARCPCLTESGMYQSIAECMEAVSFGRNWVECANGLDFSAQDSPELRADLHCAIAELKQRSQCLMGSSCSDDDIVACMTETLDCPKLPLDVLSQFAVQCQVAFSR